MNRRIILLLFNMKAALQSTAVVMTVVARREHGNRVLDKLPATPERENVSSKSAARPPDCAEFVIFT